MWRGIWRPGCRVHGVVVGPVGAVGIGDRCVNVPDQQPLTREIRLVPRLFPILDKEVLSATLAAGRQKI